MRRTRLEAVLTLDDELLVALTGPTPGQSRWLHSQMSVQAVMLLSRWQRCNATLDIEEDGCDTVLRPDRTQVGLRFRQQAAVASVDVVRAD